MVPIKQAWQNLLIGATLTSVGAVVSELHQETFLQIWANTVTSSGFLRSYAGRGHEGKRVAPGGCSLDYT